jgi:cell division protein FtsI (penicillin-binding protein 3)
VSAPIFKRIAEATLRHMSVPPTINAPAPVLVAGDGAPVPVSMAESTLASIDRLPDVPGTVPDVRGMTARDAMRKVTSAGMVVHLSGDGIVVTQNPLPGEALIEGAMATLTLERSAAGTSPAPSRQ